MFRSVLLLCLLSGSVVGLEEQLEEALGKTDRTIHDVLAVMTTLTGHPLKMPNPYDETSHLEDFDGNGETDILVENIDGRGVTGNRDYFLFCSLNGKLRLVGGFGNIFKTVRYEKTGNAYLISSGKDGLECRMTIHRLQDGVIRWKARRTIRFGGDEGIDSTLPDVRLFLRLRDFTYAEEDLLKIFNEPLAPDATAK